jgi:hypothetical protein
MGGFATDMSRENPVTCFRCIILFGLISLFGN